MFGIQASNIYGAGDAFGCLNVYSTGPMVRCLGQRRKDEPVLVGDVGWIHSFAVSASQI
jgi:hypothetical protein